LNIETKQIHAIDNKEATDVLTSENKCSYCPGTKCCQYITQQIDTPRKKSEFQVMLWQISHRFVEFYKDSDGWFLMFLTPCEHLDEYGGCGIYEHRLDICRDYSKALIYSSEILLNLINDILDFSKIDANKIELDTKEINIRHCIEKIIQTFLFNANQKKLKLSYLIEANVPDIILGDQKRLSQILLNLIGNAIKFTRKGGVNIDITNITKSIEKDNSLQLTDQCILLFKVKDSGIGISAEDQKIIFERFTQIGNDTFSNNTGTGLGTTISKELVKIMGGKIFLKSELGKGSEFSFTIRFDIPQTQNAIDKNANEIVNNKTKLEVNLQILIAEDDDINAMILEQFLLDQGLISKRVENGQKALDLLQLQQFDIVFMDLHMPILSGLETTRKIRENNQSLIIIGLTANATTQHKEICLQAGMNDFLSKPVTPTAINEVISEHIQT